MPIIVATVAWERANLINLFTANVTHKGIRGTRLVMMPLQNDVKESPDALKLLSSQIRGSCHPF